MMKHERKTRNEILLFSLQVKKKGERILETSQLTSGKFYCFSFVSLDTHFTSAIFITQFNL